jgi:hypothetical protein
MLFIQLHVNIALGKNADRRSGQDEGSRPLLLSSLPSAALLLTIGTWVIALIYYI